MKIGILTGGGDCPGLNAVIRAVTKKAILDYDMELVGFEDGYEGLIKNKFRSLQYHDVSGILTLGGTILGTSNKANPYKYISKKTRLPQDVSKEAIENTKREGIDCLVCIGGDGTLQIANKLRQDSIPIIGIPKTIDNDIRGTEIAFGFNTAVEIVAEGIDRIHTTAQSHHRVMIMEVMGRTAGWIALYAGIAGGGDIILIPEIPYDVKEVVNKVKERSKKGKRFSIVVVAEGARPKGGDVVIKKIVEDATEPVRLGGIGFMLGEQIENLTGLEARAVVMGHLQRGGSPSAYDRVLATQLGTRAVEMAVDKKFGYMVGIKGNRVIDIPLAEVAEGPRLVPLDHPLVKSARSVGTCFGT
ncbi:MAG: ATP-dependent 6-phosphofructokinase [Thermodesulfobacteriota bacterium]|nr:ATP-dependent 6-phosphofructokinase [Thermodesulfobacteriota bacterium]